MSKKTLKRAVKNARVIAIPSRIVKDKQGNVIKTLYDIFKLR